MAAVLFVPPLVMAIGVAAYHGLFSEDDRIKHSIVAGVLLERTRRVLAPGEHPVLGGVEIMGVNDDDEFFHYERHEMTPRFLKYWRKQHEELPFREDTETFLKKMGVSELESAMRFEIRFFYKEGVDEVDRKVYQATYSWQRDGDAKLLAFPVYEKTKAEESDGIVMFTQKIIYASLSKENPRETDHPQEKVVTKDIQRLAGPRGDFYQGVPESYRPVVNLTLAFWGEEYDGYRFLKMVDTLGLTYVYDLETDFIAQWPSDGPDHLWVKLQPVH